MHELPPDAAALIRSGRDALRPDASDRERVLKSLKRKLGNGAFLDGPRDIAPTNGAAAARLASRWGKILGGLSVLAVGGAFVVAAHHGSGAPTRVQSAPADSGILPADTAGSATVASSSGDESALEAPRTEHGSRSFGSPRGRGRSAAPSVSDSLAEEVNLLSRAERQMGDGSAEAALKTLAEHERRFPKGALAEQRMAARVEVLCTLARFDEARADLTKLARAYPRSAHLEGARRFCGDGLAGAP